MVVYPTVLTLAVKLTIKLKNYCSYNKQPCKSCTTVAVLVSTLLARDSMLSALYAIARPSVRLSVRQTGGSVENG